MPLPQKFQATLPLLPVLKPTTQDGSGDYYELTATAANASILSGLRTQIWGYNGIFPGPTIEARSGRKVVVTLRNELPVPIVNHLHGGKTPSASDGYPTDLVLPKQGWTAQQMRDPQANIAVGRRDYLFPNEQQAATLWYHDHRMDFTGPQMWRGLAGLYILRDQEEELLPLPKGDKEIALVICDRSFDADGSLLYPSLDQSLRAKSGVDHAYMGGVLGDVILVNGVPWPRLEVSNTLYRFRVLNASNARQLELTLDPKPKEGAVFLQIGSDGGLLGAPVPHPSLPIAPAERFDILVDFSKYSVGTQLVLRNKQARDGTSELMRFDVVRQERNESMVPAKLAEFERLDPRQAVATRTFDFFYAGMDRGWVINGKPFDPTRMDAQPRLGTTEIWRLRSDFHHPLHLHLAHFQLLTHGGRPLISDAGWKDTVNMVAGETAEVLVKFDGYRGRYVFHCHNLEHEDMAMMGNFEVI
jgi:spore coat protein A